MTKTLLAGSVLALSLTLSMAASAHITLENQKATPGASYKAVFRVPHGCAGSPTVQLRIRIPNGFLGVKPMPKPGWTLATVRSSYDHSYELYHASVSEGVTEVEWAGGRLPDDHYDEFVLVGFISNELKTGSTLYFPVVQGCESGVTRWIEIPAEGAKQAPSHPAPALKLEPKPQ
jgi:uncharacterized protein YcnI